MHRHLANGRDARATSEKARCTDITLSSRLCGLDSTSGAAHRLCVARLSLVFLCLTALVSAGAAPLAPPPEKFQSDAEFLELLQRKAFDYFWLEANPKNGLISDRSRTNSYCSIAAVGFGLTAIGIGVDHGWITREQGRTRVRATLRVFWEKPQGTNLADTIGC